MGKRRSGWRSPIPDVDAVRAVLRLLAHELCRHILMHLAKESADASTLSKALKRPVSTIRSNLKRLEKVGFVKEAQTRGRSTTYCLTKNVEVQMRPRRQVYFAVRTARGSKVAVQLNRM